MSKKTGWAELDAIIDEGVAEIAEETKIAMKDIVHIRTGNLRDSISTEIPDKHSFDRKVGVDVQKLTTDKRNPKGKNYSIPYYYGMPGTSWAGHKFLEETLNVVDP